MIAQLDLFKSTLPRKPYCTDELSNGLIIRQADGALQRRYIQPNPHCLRYWLTFDIDRLFGAQAWMDADGNPHLPPPTITTTNEANGHAHVMYGIDVPVVTSDAGRAAPLRYAAAVEAAYTEALGADRGYSGLICKNPLHPHWITRTPGGVYDLGELSEWVDLSRYSDRRRRVSESGLGRNVTLFDRLRRWAYRNVDEYRQGAPFEAWLMACQGKAEHYNDFPSALVLPEVLATAKSVARWTWTRYMGRMPDQQFSAIQAARVSKRWARESKKSEGLALIATDPTLSDAAVAAIVGVDRRTVYNWRNCR